jgi:hypothetical protein
MKKQKIPRKLSLVKFIEKGLTPVIRNMYPFKTGMYYVFLGEIPNMPDHCILLDTHYNKVYSGYHTENFEEVSENET